MCDAIASKYSDDIGKMLVHTGVIGWILSSAAQVTAIVINDKLSKEQKCIWFLKSWRTLLLISFLIMQ